jgi:mono/diheme cytochrome c family protein
VIVSRCQTCHGASGGGSVGPKLSDGRVVEQYPDVADQIEVVTEGRGSMPAFGEKLDPDEIEAVVRYTREVL